MKVESKVTEKVTKEEKVLTISEREFDDVVNDVAKFMIERNIKNDIDPMIRLALTVEYGIFSSKLQSALFNKEETKDE